MEEQDTSSLVSISHSASATVPVCIEEVDTDSKFIFLHNSSDKDQAMVHATTTYKVTPKYVLKVRQEVTMWVSDAGVS